MIHDLRGAGSQTRSADVLVIGAGTVGLIIAAELAERGQRVVCLESGGEEQAEEIHPLNAVEQVGTEYAGAEHGRFRCLGGSSTRWGGALIPFQNADLVNGGWPITWADLEPWLPRVESLFDLPAGSYDDPSILAQSGHLARLAKWPAFGKRNVYSLLRKQVDIAPSLQVWINATATDFSVTSGRVTKVLARAEDGSHIAVDAANVVVACGAIESTRLLHLIDRQSGGVISSVSPKLGEGFQDHLSAVVAEIVPANRSELNRLVGFRFEPGGSMRNLRFELAPDASSRKSVAPCFAHIGFSDTPGGFAALRDLFRALQRRRLPTLSVISRLIADLPWLLRAVWWRFIHRRLLYPADAQLLLHMVIEQQSTSSNRIGLSDSKHDVFGQPCAKIEWTVSESDVTMMERAVDAFETTWNEGPLSKLGRLERRPIVDIARDMASGGGIYHPGSSTPMADDAMDGVVDRELRVFGVQNLTVCATSVLPSGGGANPTMMAILLALRLVDHLTPKSSVSSN